MRPAPKMPKRGEPRSRVVAIVGSQSFLGRRLCAALADDPAVDRIVAVDIRPPETTSPKLQYVRVDLTRPAATGELTEALGDEQAGSLVHLAFLGARGADDAYAHELEVIGTMHVLAAAAAAGTRRLILQSTTAVYGAHPKNPNVLPETRAPLGSEQSRFVSDKLEAERQLLRFAGERRGVSVAVLRLGPVVGPQVENLFTRYLLGRLSPTILGHDPLLQALHEDDAVAALRLALRRGEARGIFNVVAGGVVPVSTALALCGTRALPLPYGVAGRALELLNALGVTPAPASFVDFLRYTCVADGARARAELGFEARHTTRDALVALAGRRGPGTA